MDEDPEPRGTGRRARPRTQTSHRVGVHRVNDFIVGHVGQVSYSPAGEDVEVGQVNVGRLTEQPPFCQQVMPFRECIASSRLAVKLPPSRAFQRNRSQRNWLLKTHPEAFLGFPDLPAVLSQESPNEATEVDKSSPVGPVAAVGEIADLRRGDMSRNLPWPAVAIVSGEAGHVLRLTAMELEKWTWKDLSMPVGIPQSTLHGSWCDDGSPILQIQFAKRLKPFDNLYWLVVQKETSITIFEPELRAWPIAAAASHPDNDSGSLEHIALNPVVTLTTRTTGLRSHCDFSLDMGSGTEAPQLSVIDGYGSWSIWYLLRVGHGRSRTMKLMLRRRGTFPMPANGPLRGIPEHLYNWVKVLWMAKPAPANDWRRDSTPSEDVDPGPSSLQASYLAESDTPRVEVDGLMLCDRQQIRVLDIDSERFSSKLEFTRRDGKDVLIDAQSFPGLPSHHLILTTHRLYLIDASKGNQPDGRGPRVMISCPHYRTSASQGLKMLVSKQEPIGGGSMCLVLLYSADNIRINAFWFRVDGKDICPRFHHQVLQLQGFKIDDPTCSLGILSLTAIPLQLTPSNGNRHSTAMESEAELGSSRAIRFFQIFALSTDLGLHFSIIAVTPDATDKVDMPSKAPQSTRREVQRSRSIRRRILREAEQAFTVPDDVVRSDHRHSRLSVVRLFNDDDPYETFQLRHFYLKLVDEINDDLQGKARGRRTDFDSRDPFALVRAASQDADDSQGYVPLKPLLHYLDQSLPRDLSQFEDDWQNARREYKKFRRIQLSACGSYVHSETVMDVFEKLSINWSSQLPAESLKASQWVVMEKSLQRMAIELFLSERGVYVVPQSVLDLAAKTATEQQDSQITGGSQPDLLPSSQLRSSQILPTPSATPASSSRATSEDASSSKSITEAEDAGHEDAAVARLRKYLPAIKFTPVTKGGPSHVISLWPEQRGVDPSEYQHRPLGKGKDEMSEATKRKRERHQERERRRAERKAQRAFKVDLVDREWESQPLAPTTIQSSPVHGRVGSSQGHSLGSDFGMGMGSQTQSQSQGFSQGFGFSQIMSQPVAGEFGGRPRKLKGKPKPKKPKIFR